MRYSPLICIPDLRAVRRSFWTDFATGQNQPFFAINQMLTSSVQFWKRSTCPSHPVKCPSLDGILPELQILGHQQIQKITYSRFPSSRPDRARSSSSGRWPTSCSNALLNLLMWLLAAPFNQYLAISNRMAHSCEVFYHDANVAGQNTLVDRCDRRNQVNPALWVCAYSQESAQQSMTSATCEL